jgi:predicted kinase
MASQVRGLLIIPCGISGSGKSRLRKALQDRLDVKVVCPDDIRRELFGDVSDQSDGKKVFDIARERVTALLTRGEVVFFDATNLHKAKTRIEQWAQFSTADWMVVGLADSDDPDLCYSRIKDDLAAGTDRSKVPEEAVFAQAEKWNKTPKDDMTMIRSDSDVDGLVKSIKSWMDDDLRRHPRQRGE